MDSAMFGNDRLLFSTEVTGFGVAYLLGFDREVKLCRRRNDVSRSPAV